MRAKSYAGYRLTARRPASSAAVEHWWAEGPDGPAEVYLGPEMLLRRARALPVWGPFADIITGQQGLRSFVVVRGRLDRSVDDLRRMMSPGACVAFAWHLAAALAEVHEQGGAHGALHPGWTGVDAEGRLTVRPALTAAVRSEPDGDATAQATDCIQLASILEALDLERIDEPALSLMMRGIARDRSRLRLQPGRAVRQSLSYILNRHDEWETALVETLGPDWHTSLLPRAMPLPEPVARHPWNEHGTHIPHVGSSSTSSLTATVDVLAATARTSASSESAAGSARDAAELPVGSRARGPVTGTTSSTAGVRVMVRKASASVRPVKNRLEEPPGKRRAAESVSYGRSLPAPAAVATSAATATPTEAVAGVARNVPAASVAASLAIEPGLEVGGAHAPADPSPDDSSAAVAEPSLTDWPVESEAAAVATLSVSAADSSIEEADAEPSVVVPELSADLETATDLAQSAAVLVEPDSAEASLETGADLPEVGASEGASTVAAVMVEPTFDEEKRDANDGASGAMDGEADDSEASALAGHVEGGVEGDRAGGDADGGGTGGVDDEVEDGEARGAEAEVVADDDSGSEGEVGVLADELAEAEVEDEDEPEGGDVVAAGAEEQAVVHDDDGTTDATVDAEAPGAAADSELEAEGLVEAGAEDGLDAGESVASVDVAVDSVIDPAAPPGLGGGADEERDALDAALALASESDEEPISAAPALASLLADIAPANLPEPTVDTVAPLASLAMGDAGTDDPDSIDEVFEDDENTAVTTVPEPVRQALERLNASRSVRDLTAPSASEAVQPVVATPLPKASLPVPPPPTPSAAMPGEEMPRWAGIKGVTGDASREEELGSGKWEEEARPLSELRREMGQAPVREMEDIGPSRGNWPMLVLFLAGLFALVALWLYTQTGLFTTAG